MKNIRDFDRIMIQLASPERILEWSYGEVKKPETINYRSLRPERDGLFCEKIFGTTKEWECYCGKFKSIRYKGVVCDRCGVEVSHFKVRRERMGHIDLASPVSHIWYYKSVPSRIGLLLDMSMNDLRSVIYFEKCIVIDPGESTLEPFSLITEEEYLELKEKHGNNFEAGIGADVILKLLSSLDLKSLRKELHDRMLERGQKTDPRTLKRLQIIDDFIHSGNKPEWMIMTRIPVIPPELRPMVQLDGGRFATSDLNDLYRRVINRNNRLKRLQELYAPEIIIRNEKRMLQEAVDALFDNSKRKRMVKGPGNRPLKSLSDMLKGKQGRFRQNLLGKRVDYSGRSVIVVGPELKLHQCGLPKKMALELFKPFVMKRLSDRGHVYNLKSAKKMVERESEEVWGVLEEVVREHPVLLNRAPTLHRLGIQAFEPVLVDTKAIKLHPLVCHAFNADFDGDQMAVHVPLSPEAQIECWVLMLSSKNLLNPANGQPIVGPTQDMVLGICYLTKEDSRLAKARKLPFANFQEVMIALEFRDIHLQEPIKVRYNDGYLITTPGRIIFNELLPDDYVFVNYELRKKEISTIIADVFNKYGAARLVAILDDIKDLGFRYATLFGVTIGVDDLKIPEEKATILEEVQKKVENVHEMYRSGHLTNAERYNMIINEWTQANNKISSVLFHMLKEDKNGFNSIYIMADSGARGSQQQIKQLAGMRGLMAKPSGEIIEYPIISNFKEGLNVLEYFISTHGARKGLADTALKTADAGYLTRRLVDIAQDVMITEQDCGTVNGIEMRAIEEGDTIIETLAERITGRVTTDDVFHPKTGEIIVRANEEINDEQAEHIEKCGIDSVRIRTVLTCEAVHGICAMCYGRNLATNCKIEFGEAVGTIAAQSIGQPGTQLTMRTFHIGGIAAGQTREDTLVLKYDAIVRALPDNYIPLSNPLNKKLTGITPRKSEMVVQRIIASYNVTRWQTLRVREGDTVIAGDVIGIDENGREVRAPQHAVILLEKKTHMVLASVTDNVLPLKVGSLLFATEGEEVKAGTPFAKFDPYSEPIIAELAGTIYYENMRLGQNVKETIDEKTGRKQLVALEARKKGEEQLRVRITPAEGESREYMMPGGAILVVEEGKTINLGDTIARTPREQTKTKDITGGLPRVAELFEARRPKDPAVISKIDGAIIVDAQISKNKRIVWVDDGKRDEEDNFPDDATHKYAIPVGKHLLVRNGDDVKAGDQLCDGAIDPHDILEVKGEQELMRYLMNEVQEVYRLQGVKIHDKHIGVIIRQMLRKVEITDVGDTDFIIEQKVNRTIFRKKNDETIERGGQPAQARPILLGLTKASISIESFLSAASFQETTKVLTNAAIQGKIDNLRGLKENVIIGHKIPAGTGMDIYDRIEMEWPQEEEYVVHETRSDDEYVMSREIGVYNIDDFEKNGFTIEDEDHDRSADLEDEDDIESLDGDDIPDDE
ncbi:MAG: DNA-directed RNA polymerase subunit beta' [Spirochaetota bacterium]|jgi:DNA-directed RNA polymerase subunit beta'|nr:DNA-directed RNA polymerase subunit beta' [Spirochaetota bacterium]